MKQSLWMVYQNLRALMKSVSWKLLALLSVGMFASPAFAGPVTWLPVNYPATISWIIQQAQDGSLVGGTSGVLSNPSSDIPFWLSVVDNNNVATFTNPSGPGTAKVNVSVPWVDANAPSVLPANGQQFANNTLVLVGFSNYAQVVGPPSQTPLQLLWFGDYSLSGATTNQTNVTFDLSVQGIEDTWSCAVGCSSGSFAGSVNVRPGQILSETIAASAYSQNGGPTGTAYLDPYFYFTPAEVAEGYSLEFSEFVGNTPPGSVSGSAVPEPVTLSLFGTGVVGAIAMRRRKKKAA
jgi:hypothetical protein